VSVVAQKSRERDGDAARRGSAASKKIVISARIRRVTIFFSYCERNHRHEPRLCMRCRWMRERDRCPLVIGPLDISARRPTARAPIPLSRWMTSNELSELQARAFLRSAWRFCRIIWPRARARAFSHWSDVCVCTIFIRTRLLSHDRIKSESGSRQKTENRRRRKARLFLLSARCLSFIPVIIVVVARVSIRINCDCYIWIM